MPKQKGFQLLGAKKRRLAKASLMALVKNRLRITIWQMSDCQHWGFLVLKVTYWTISFSDIIDTFASA